MSSSVASGGPTRIAVFGSLAAAPRRVRAARSRVPRFLSPSAAAVFERSLELVAAKAPDIARPILDRAVAAGTITGAERRELLGELAGSRRAPSGPPPRAELARLQHEVSAAVRRAAPGLAQPLLSAAVASERLTRVQEQRIVERLRQGAPRPVSSLM